MADIRIVAMDHGASPGGPDMPTPYSAWLDDREWPGGGTVRVVKFLIGNDVIQVWPADSKYLREFGEKIIKLADVLEKEAK